MWRILVYAVLFYFIWLCMNIEKDDHTNTKQEYHHTEYLSSAPIQTQEPQQGDSTREVITFTEKIATTESEEELSKEQANTSNDTLESTHIRYEAPEEAPWWAPVQGSDIRSEYTEQGQEGQVSTVWGNGTQGQNERHLDRPRDIQIDSKGNIYFVDGDHRNAKVRMFDGKQNQTIVDLVNNKVAERDGYFLSAGMVIIDDHIYVASDQDVYLVKDGRITQLTPKIQAYMEKMRLENIYRLEKYKNYLYIMFANKSHQFHIARYPVAGGEVEQVIETKPISSPYNFYVAGENDIFIASQLGYVFWETLFPRETRIAWEAGDPKTEIVDMWIGKDDALYFVAWENQALHQIYRNPKGIDAGEVSPIVGSRRGFVDGFSDEVQLDYPIDFVWDGSGYLFADMGNHTIRKYWTDVGPK